MNINITVTASVNGFLDAWVDFNVDGDWADPGEHIFATQWLVAGPNALSFAVPGTSVIGQSYARFRFRTAQNVISYTGLQQDGEVEDYPVFIDECSQGDEMDFGDAPDMPPVGYNYPTLLSSNGARHFKYLNIRMGALIDPETNGQPNTPSLGDDMAFTDDEDGVAFIGKMYVGKPANIQVTASISGFLNAWMDFNKDGDWGDPGEQIFTNQPLVAGLNALTFNIPATALQGKTYTRFRFNTLGGLTYAGLALNGEVEDYQVHACPKWWPIPTNRKHYITIPHDLPNLTAGDVLGVFYHDAAGMEVCGGLSEFNGMDDQIMIAYGDNPNTPEKDGFIIGEPITWKLCSYIKGDANPVDVEYDFTYPNHDGLWALNGISALGSVNGLNVSAGAEPALICSGDDVQLSAFVGDAGGVAFNWISIPAGFNSAEQNPVAAPTVNTTYIVHAFDGVFHAYDTVEVAVTQASPLVETLPLAGVTIADGDHYCFNATVSITTAGSGTLFTVQSGGAAQLIAGQFVKMLPGTRAMAGSHLVARITTDGQYCCNNGIPFAPVTGQEEAIVPVDESRFYRVYPNPTTGTFTLDLMGADVSSKVSVELYGILGERILHRDLPAGTRQQVFDLSGRQHGVYLIRVLNGTEMGVSKIVKQ